MVTIKLSTMVKLGKGKIEFLELTLKNYEALKKLDTVFEQNDVKIIYSIVLRGNAQTIKSFYVLQTNGNFEEIVEKIRTVGEVLNISYGAKIIEGFTISPFTIVINIPLMNEKALLLPSKSLIQSFRRIRKRWGLASLVFLYHLGYNYGVTLAEKFLENGFDSEKALILSLEFLRQTGLFKDYNLVMFNSKQGNIVLHIYESVECVNSSEKETSSHFLRGIIGGLVSEIVGKEVTVYETKCVARGDRYCEFIS